MKNAWKIIKEDETKIIIDVFISDNEGYEKGNHDRLNTITLCKNSFDQTIIEYIKEYYNYDLESERII